MSISDIKNCSEKERLVMLGLSKLICKGQDVRSITAGDIAREAGVGKGTLYLYFKTKDDIIIKTALYMLWQETENIRKSVGTEKSFLGKCHILFDMLCPEETEGASMLNMFLMLHTLTSDETMIKLADEYRRSIVSEIGEILSEIIECGIECGEVPGNADKLYLIQGMVSIVSGVLVLSSAGADKDALKENSRKMLDALLQ